MTPLAHSPVLPLTVKYLTSQPPSSFVPECSYETESCRQNMSRTDEVRFGGRLLKDTAVPMGSLSAPPSHWVAMINGTNF